MKTYSFINGNRYRVVSIYRSFRFSIDRLEINIVFNDSRPSFVRGVKITNFDSNVYILVDGAAADDLVYVMAKILSSNAEDDSKPYDSYLADVMKSKNNFINPCHSDDHASSAIHH